MPTGAWRTALALSSAILAGDRARDLARLRSDLAFHPLGVEDDIHVATCIGLILDRFGGYPETLEACRAVSRRIVAHIDLSEHDILLMAETCALSWTGEPGPASAAPAVVAGRVLRIVGGHVLVSPAVLPGLAGAMTGDRAVLPGPDAGLLLAYASSDLHAGRWRGGLATLRLLAALGGASARMRPWLAAIRPAIGDAADPLEASKLRLLAAWTDAVLDDPSRLRIRSPASP